MQHQDWFFVRDGKQRGPFPAKQLQQLAASGDLRPDDLIWRQGMDQWVLAESMKGLFRPERPAESPQHKACPFCGETILAAAKKCKHCGEYLDPTLRAANGVPHPVVVVAEPYRVPHLLHFVLTILTCGAWLPIWIIHCLLNRV